MSSDGAFPIVGIGASAGGVQAFEQFFKTTPSNSGCGFIIVGHFSPNHKSILHEIIERCTNMRVFVADSKMSVQPDCIYVMPPKVLMTVERGSLQLREADGAKRERNPIDIFFASLAKDCGEYAVGIVLSGGGGDGTLGLKAIKAGGGLTLAQTSDGSAPLHPDMPRSAIAAGIVDYAVPVERMAERLEAFRQGFNPGERFSWPGTAEDRDETERGRRIIYDVLHKRTGHDFSGYKVRTFMRRVQRRMQILQVKDLSAYIALLDRDPEEVTALFRDLLINVTNFFRDSEAFNSLRDLVIGELFKDKGADDTVRVWIPGCATGEEAYTIGIMLREHMDTLRTVPRVQIFATDIDNPALAVARAGRYPRNLLDNITPERRERFFVEENEMFTVAKEIRDLCVFSPHSVIRDPPFSRIDLVSCRNLLIYFGVEIQSQVIPVFHYALKPGGYLFLGTSENIGQFSDLFASLDKKQRIFQARDHGATRRLPAIMYGPRHMFPPHQTRSSNTLPLRHVVESTVVDKFSPAHVVVNADWDIVYYSLHTGKYLEMPQGPPSRQMMTMARKGLRLALRGALQAAIETRQPVTRRHVTLNDEGSEPLSVTLSVEPLPERDTGEPLFLILFEEVKPPASRDVVVPSLAEANHSVVAALEVELRETRERLQSMVEEYETALEELKSSNEELVSVNEELQSTNEELEASKEELQSVNEELQTVNLELTSKLDDLDRTSNDLRNLFDATQIATVFLDRNLVIRSFTPAVSRIFRLIPGDRGRPLTDLAIHPSYPALQDHVRQVFKTGETIEHRITEAVAETRYLVRLIPYRDRAGKIAGVVITFVDITTLAKAEEQQDVLIAELNHRVKNMLTVAISITRQMSKQDLSVADFSEALTGRLHAMAGAYELIARDNWTEVRLDTIIEQRLAPFDPNRVATVGPPVMLKPKLALSLGMVVHELATNAAKYGAFSDEHGRVEVAWSVGDDDRLSFGWTERGGAHSGELKRGFGLRLIEREITFGLNGTVDVALEPEGLAVNLAFAR